MSERRLMCVLAGLVVGVGLFLALSGPAVADAPNPEIIVPYEPSPPMVVKAMLKLAKVGPEDTVYDLGCGDGRIVVMGVKEFGAKKGIGVDLDPERIKECKENATNAAVTDKVVWIQGNIFDQSLKEASVVTAYLLPNVNLMVRPILYRDLKPGSRVVTHAFNMADWEPDAVDHPKKARGQIIMLYIIPASVGGTWEMTVGSAKCTGDFDQEFQFFKGTVASGSGEPARVADQTLKGTEIAFSTKIDGKDAKFRGTVDGNTIKGTAEVAGAKQDWTATRKPVDVTGTWTITVTPAEKKLDGVLTIEKKESGALAATYSLNADKKPIPIGGLFVWGPCVRFEIPTGAASVDFKGRLIEGTGKGVVNCEGWASEPTWVAKKEGK